MAVKGTWFGLPDLGITELLGAKPTGSYQASTFYNPAVVANPQNRSVNDTTVVPQSTTFAGTQSRPQTLSNTGMNSNTPLNLPTGSGGGGGGSNTNSHINPATGQWDDNYYASQQNGGGGYDAAAAAQAELDAALGELDYAKENLQAQSGQLDTQRAGALSTLDTEYGKAEKEKGLAMTEATQATAEAKNKALSTANDVTKKNRNVLRALGILSSSAGGEILTKAMTEYGTQAGELQQGLIKRLATVEDWWMNRQQEFTKAKTDLETQYATLKENINRDLRFNDRQRLSAVKAAQAAMQQRVYEVAQQQLAYQTAAKQYSDNILLKIAEMKMYQNPSADVTAIYNQLLSSAQGSQQPRQVGIAQSEEERRKTLSGQA